MFSRFGGEIENVKHKSKRQVAKVKDAVGARTRPDSPVADVSESFRKARSALVQISADFERMRRDAGSLVKAAHRTAK